MKKLFIILILFFSLIGCEQDNSAEDLLILPVAAEPSATMYNERGIDFYRQGDYQEAVIAFVQARAADHTAGEIHFNLALTRLKMNETAKARESFKLAIKHSYGNPKILQSPLLIQTMGTHKQ